MTPRITIVLVLIGLIAVTNIFGQCTICAPNQGCCMGRMHGQWSCCGIQSIPALGGEEDEATPWNFDLQIKYDVYAWDCSPSNSDPTQQYTNVSCLLDGRWSLDQLTFQLRAIPSTVLKVLPGEYTMKDNSTRKIAFQADSQWALTVPVDKNTKPAIYDQIEFNYNGFNYTYYFGYGPYPHCPRC